MEHVYDLKAAIDALTDVRYVHHTIPDPTPDDPKRLKLVTVAHPPLITLLESGTKTSRGSGAPTGGMVSVADEDALEKWAQIRDQVRVWLGQLRAPWSDDLKTDLRTWHAHHELAVARRRTIPEADVEIGRIVQAWVERIERKYDPDERREWTEPCPAVTAEIDRWGAPTGHTHRCGARRIMLDGTWQFAISLNVTKREAECRSCGTTWVGERQLMQLRYESNLWELERALEAAPEPETPKRRELALTGPIDLP